MDAMTHSRQFNFPPSLISKRTIIAQRFFPDDDTRLREALTINFQPMPNSAPLHRTEMINNVVQDIDENVKV